MARRKNRPEAVQEKCQLSIRLRQIRTELFGDRGGSEMARRLGIPVRTWYNYESGVTVPAEVLLRFLELTAVEPIWLLHGRGSRFRAEAAPLRGSANGVRDLLRTALMRLSQRDGNGSTIEPLGLNALHSELDPEHPASPMPRAIPGDVVLVRVDEQSAESSRHPYTGPPFLATGRELLGHIDDEHRCMRVEDDAMSPLLALGAYVAYSDAEEDLETLNGSLVVAWVNDRPLARWFELTGRFAVLRAENPSADGGTMLLDLEDAAKPPRIRRVLWKNTPHH